MKVYLLAGVETEFSEVGAREEGPGCSGPLPLNALALEPYRTLPASS
jgi:hypothetical protein